jgi:hypothetical protein
MADNIVGGLFGVDPQQLMRQRQATDAANAFRYAQLDPLAQAKMSIYQGGAGLARGVGGLLGGDPELEKVSAIKQLSSQFDLTSSTGIRDFARALQPQFPQEAMMAAQRADAMETTGLTQAKLQSEATKNLREQRIPTSPLGKLLFERDELIKGGAPLNDPKVLAYDRNIASEQKGKGNVEVNLGGVFDKMFTKKEAEDQAETWNKAGQAYADASKLARSVREMETVVGNAFVGSYGSLKAGVSRALGGGKKLEDTEVLDALSAQLVLPLAKLLPGSLAVKELDQLIKTKPNLNQQEATIRRLLGTINQDLRASEITYEAGEKYRAANKGSIQGFNPYITNNKATRLTELQGIFNKNGKLTEAQKREAQTLTKELQVEVM